MMGCGIIIRIQVFTNCESFYCLVLRLYIFIIDDSIQVFLLVVTIAIVSAYQFMSSCGIVDCFLVRRPVAHGKLCVYRLTSSAKAFGSSALAKDVGHTEALSIHAPSSGHAVRYTC